MQINSISHVNFGLKYFKDMKDFLEQSKNEAAKKGELDSFEKAEKKLTECAPTNYVLRLVTLPDSNNKKGIQLYEYPVVRPFYIPKTIALYCAVGGDDGFYLYLQYLFPVNPTNSYVSPSKIY